MNLNVHQTHYPEVPCSWWYSLRGCKTYFNSSTKEFIASWWRWWSKVRHPTCISSFRTLLARSRAYNIWSDNQRVSYCRELAKSSRICKVSTSTISKRLPTSASIWWIVLCSYRTFFLRRWTSLSYLRNNIASSWPALSPVSIEETHQPVAENKCFEDRGLTVNATQYHQTRIIGAPSVKMNFHSGQHKGYAWACLPRVEPALQCLKNHPSSLSPS